MYFGRKPNIYYSGWWISVKSGLQNASTLKKQVAQKIIKKYTQGRFYYMETENY